MSEQPRPPESGEEVRTPVWVYSVGIALVLLAGGFIVMHLAGGGVPQH